MIRVMTIRIEPDDRQWKLLRLRAMQAAAYRNKFAQAQLADALKWRTPEGASKDKLTKIIRAETGDLSSSAYVACEAEVRKDWTRSAKKIMAGAALPQYKAVNALGFATISGRPGVQILETETGFTVRLMLSANHVAGGCWITLPVSRRTNKDEYRIPMLQKMANGSIPILMARVIFKLYAGKTLLQLTYPLESHLPEMGHRHATLSELDDGRVLLRTDVSSSSQDYTSRIHHLKALKTNWDAITRRWRSQLGKRKGHARLARKKNAHLRFDDRQNTYLHQWSRQMVDWLETQGVGTLSIVLVGGDWAAHRLEEYLAYKCEERHIRIVQPDMADQATERSLKAVARKKQRKAKKLGEATREVTQQLVAL